jgi:aminoglycoside phosphotransferase (APT) family kinase protein
MAVRALCQVELTDAQIDALLSVAELAEAAWWDNPALQRRLAALNRARRTLVDARRAQVDGSRRCRARTVGPVMIIGGVEIEIDEPFLRRLLEEQHPDLAGLPLAQVAGGWDNQMWQLGGELALRIPRTPRAHSLLRREQRWLPGLASRLPLPVPTPVRVGEPSEHFPRPWTVARWVAGVPADQAPIQDTDHAAVELGHFLRSLHTEAPARAPRNPARGVPLSAVTDDFHERLDAVTADVDAVRVRHVWEHAVAAPDWDGPPMWLHADLHPANIVTAGGRLAGVIDFGELCAGDPATDLAAAWTLLPDGGAGRFFAAYGKLDQATIIRARGWAVLFALGLIAIGNAGVLGLPGGKPTWRAAGRRTLDRVLEPHDGAFRA